MDALLKFVQTANGYLADYILVILLIGVGLYFTIRTRFVQVRCFGEGMKSVFGGIKLFGKKNKSGLTSFQALATAIAAQVGTGNIVGASGAILTGGPGAIFWMWIIAFLGMATIYAEAVLAQETRIKGEDGEIHGGPVYYIKKAFKGGFGKFLAGFFAIAIILALGFMGSMVQSNSIAGSIVEVFPQNMNPVLFSVAGIDVNLIFLIVGILVAAVAAFIFIGGVQRIASVTEKLVPVMAVLFLLGGIVVLFANITSIPATFGMIFKYAFTPKALIGGGIGYALKTAISQGAKRGLFSNEAGMGSTPHAHAMANVEKPHDQGVVAMVGVFIDTFVVLTMTALVIISSLYCGNGPLAKFNNPETANRAIVVTVENNQEITYEDLNEYKIYTGQISDEQKAVLENSNYDADSISVISKNNAMQKSFNTSLSFLGNFGNIFVAFCLLFFAFSTIISWNFFGKINVQYMFKNSKLAILLYSAVATVFIFLGALLKSDLVWELTDFFNYLMVIPNALALLALGNIVVQSAKKKK